MKIINVFEFTEYPGLRHCITSEDSGEAFYHKTLNRTFKESFEKNEKILLNLDGTVGYPPSFIDEAIGNLVYDFTLKIVKEFLEIKSDEESYLIDDINSETYPLWEKRRINGDKPKKTKTHSPWAQYRDNKIIMTT